MSRSILRCLSRMDTTTTGYRRVFDLGVGRQSNGQGGALSRSWNYAFARLRFRARQRTWPMVVGIAGRGIAQSISEHDDRNLTDYIGYGDIPRHVAHATGGCAGRRTSNPATGKGAAQLDAALPACHQGCVPPAAVVRAGVHGLWREPHRLQLGRQNTIGAGIRLNDRPPEETGCGGNLGVNALRAAPVDIAARSPALAMRAWRWPACGPLASGAYFPWLAASLYARRMALIRV